MSARADVGWVCLKAMIAAKTGLNQELVSDVMAAMVEVVAVSVSSGDSVATPLGVFKRKYRLGRSYSANGKRMVTPSHWSPVFRPSERLRKAVR